MGRPTRYIRSRHIVCYWDGPSVVVQNYATQQRRTGDALLCRILDACDGWQPLGKIIERCQGAHPETVRLLVQRLAALRILHRSDRPIPKGERLMDSFGNWNPVAGFFHMSTKDVSFGERVLAERDLRRRSRGSKIPPPVKRYTKAATFRLPFGRMDEQFPKVLLARRTWRRFSDEAVTKQQLGDLLGLTVGFQQFVRTGPTGTLPQRTSPSGGARQPVEAYLLVLNVKGLARGLYHYASDAHVLHRIRSGIPKGGVERYLPTQDWFEGASVVLFFAGIFGRTSWCYDDGRAYRAVLIEAGHLCQTFCLTATWLGLAPFCSMALADREIENALRLNGISESVLYAAGVGCRAAPASQSFAPKGVVVPDIKRNPVFGRRHPGRRRRLR